MNWGKLAIYGFLLALVVGAFIGLAYLFMFIFVAVFNALADMMVIKGADPSWAAVVALILTVYIFVGISRNTTVNNYIREKFIG